MIELVLFALWATAAIYGANALCNLGAAEEREAVRKYLKREEYARPAWLIKNEAHL